MMFPESSHEDDEFVKNHQPRRYGTTARPPGIAPRVAYFHQPPEDNMITAVVSSIFCFCPLGCFSVYYATKARELYKKRDLNGSIKANDNSKMMSQMSIAIGIMIYIAVIITILVKISDVI